VYRTKSYYEKNKTAPTRSKTHLQFDSHLLEKRNMVYYREAMAHLNVSRSTMYRLRKQHP
jgi:hypothetical protein